MPNATVTLSPSRTAGNQQAPPPVVADASAYYIYDGQPPATADAPYGDAAAEAVVLTTTMADVYGLPRHAGGGSNTAAGDAAGAAGSVVFDRLQQQTGNGAGSAVGGSLAIDRFSRMPANGTTAVPAAGTGYKQQQQSPLMQMMYGSLRRGAGRASAASTTMSSSSSSMSLQHRDFQEVSA